MIRIQFELIKMIKENLLDSRFMKVLNRERDVLLNNSLIMDLDIISGFKMELSRISSF
jgi:hypothetical protein